MQFLTVCRTTQLAWGQAFGAAEGCAGNHMLLYHCQLLMLMLMLLHRASFHKVAGAYGSWDHPYVQPPLPKATYAFHPAILLPPQLLM